MKRKTITSLTLLLLLSTFLPMLGLRASSSSSTKVYIDPPTATARKGEDFTVAIKVEEAADLFAWQAKLVWDPQILEVVNATEGDFLKTGGPTTFSGDQLRNQTEGWMFVSAYLTEVTGVNGNGILVNVTFHGANQGESILELSGVKLFNPVQTSVATPPYWGDADNNMRVDMRDTGSIARAFGASGGDPRYDSNADFNKDGVVDLFDLLCVILNFGKIYNPGDLGNVPTEIPHDAIDGWVVIGSIIQVQPVESRVKLGDVFNVSINMAGVLDFHSLQYRLSWNPEVLQVVRLYEGDYMPGRGKSFFVYGVYEEQGQILITNTFLGPRPQPFPVPENGSLSTIEFSATHVGSCPLNVSDTSFTQRGAMVTVEEISRTQVAADHLSSRRGVLRQSSSVLTVGPAQQYSTIQDAIDAANPNDIIHVFSGTYVENLIVNKENLTLIGEGRDTTIIKGATNQPGTSVIEVRDVNRTKITEFTIEDGDSGVKIRYYSNWTTVKDNIIKDNNVGVGVVGWQTSLAQIQETLLGNNITASDGCGLVVWNTEQDVIRANNITTNHIGIQKSGPFANSVICFNNIVDNDIQLYPTTIDSVNNIQWYCTVDGNNKGNYWSPPDPDANDPYALPDIWVPIGGDINLDGEVTIVDITVAAVAFGSAWSLPRWNPQADVDKNKLVNIIDIAKIALNFGEADP